MADVADECSSDCSSVCDALICFMSYEPWIDGCLCNEMRISASFSSHAHTDIGKHAIIPLQQS
jgi:hypothetical protein